MATRTVSVALVADVGQYVTGMTRASASTKAFGTSTQATTASTGRGFDLAGKSALALGGAAVVAGVGLKSAIGSASDLNETLNKSNVIFGDNAGQIERWAKTSARDFGLSKSAALEAASGFGNMLQQLGYTGDEAVKASTGVVELAADLGSFNNLETGDVLDRIGAAMRGEYDSLQLLIPNINAARVEQEAMAATGKENAKELTAQEKATATLAIVQRDGVAASNDFAETSDGLANSTKIAKAEFENLQAEIGQRFLPIASEAMGFVSSTAIPALGGAADAAAGLGEAFTDLPTGIQIGIAAAGLWAVAGDRVVDGFGRMSGAMSPLKDTTRAFGEALDYARANGDGLFTVLRSVGDTAGGAALSGIKSLGRAIGPELAVAVGAATLFGFIDGLKSMTQASDEAKAAAEGLAKALTLTDQAADMKAVRTAIENTDGLVEVLDRAGISSQDAVAGLLGQEDAQRRVIGALQAYKAEVYAPNGGGGNREGQDAREAALAYEELATGYGTAASNARFFGAEANGAAEETEDTGTAAANAAPAVSSFATEMEAAATAADAAKKQTDQFKLALDILTGAQVSLIEVESTFREAIAAADGAMEGLNGTVTNGAGELNTQSEAGRKAADVLLGVRDSGNQLIATMVQQGATSEDVRRRDDELRNSFINTAIQMGISSGEANHLADQILGIPAERQTKILADTIAAENAIANLQRQIDGLRGRTVDIVARAIMPDLNGPVSGNGRMGTFAAGGYTGPGGKYEPAGVVHRGEVVWSQDDVAAHGGVASVDAMRRRRIPGYAEGGPVSGAPLTIRAELNARSYDTQMNALAKNVIDKYEPVQGMIGALRWAKSQVGRPYVWGGVGPGGYDCSGFMSAITNVIRGRSPYSRVGSTASFPWGGFAPGYGSFTIGSTPNAGGGIGHMAGTLLGVNVESTGGVGVKVGGSARGASNGLFGTRAHIAMASGGLIGEPVSGVGAWSGKSYSFAERGDEYVVPKGRELSGAGGASSAVLVKLAAAAGRNAVPSRSTHVENLTVKIETPLNLTNQADLRRAGEKIRDVIRSLDREVS